MKILTECDNNIYFLSKKSRKIGIPREQCPLDIPFAFNYGRKCCLYDEEGSYVNDNWVGTGNPLGFFNHTCKENLEISCSKERCISNGEMFELLLILL